MVPVGKEQLFVLNVKNRLMSIFPKAKVKKVKRLRVHLLVVLVVQGVGVVVKKTMKNKEKLKKILKEIFLSFKKALRDFLPCCGK